MSAVLRGSAAGNRHSATGREMRTRTGASVSLADYAPADFRLEDIAFGLGGYRFGNQHPARVTIAEHSVAVMLLVDAYAPNADLRLLRNALLHDASEAYTQDLTGAVKLLLRVGERQRLRPTSIVPPLHEFASAFDALGDGIQAAIEERFDAAISLTLAPLIARADRETCSYELALGGWDPALDPMPAPFTVEVLDAAAPYRQAEGGCAVFLECARTLGCA